ncbi:hypothetical protein QYE76_013780 [Lolium multiflorum]|uniref:SWIM-type domain-containing protein n=1 Tax=Lolium multiflorum TaxID=4521 RepID=A0AAD8X4W7_LOLMU|nr:hypothetical protein QYE76_013780 [Lolium multiflorum]
MGAGEETETRAPGRGKPAALRGRNARAGMVPEQRLHQGNDTKRAPPSPSSSPNHTGGRTLAHPSSGAQAANAQSEQRAPWPGSTAETQENATSWDQQGSGQGRGQEGHGSRTRPRNRQTAKQAGGSGPHRAEQPARTGDGDPEQQLQPGDNHHSTERAARGRGGGCRNGRPPRRRGGQQRPPGSRGEVRGQIPAAPITGAARALPAAASRGGEAWGGRPGWVAAAGWGSLGVARGPTRRLGFQHLTVSHITSFYNLIFIDLQPCMLYTPMESLIMYALSDGSHGMESETRPGNADDEAESGAGFFDLNQPLDSDDEDDIHDPIQENEQSGAEGNFDEDVSSHPIIPFVGMQFDNEDVALKVYNKYAYKMGFGTRICSSKYSRKRGSEQVLINRVFECVHARKGAAAATTLGELGRRRYYRSHRKILEEDLEFLELMHNRNLKTSDIMGMLGDVHGGDIRTLWYVKRDVTNERSKMRAKLLFRDMDVTLEYFKKRQDENPNFYYAKDVDEDNAIRALFWVDGRTRLLYPKYKDCVFFDSTFCTNRYNMPFAPIVGINNHLQTVVLGCALLANENKDGFRWVFERLNIEKQASVFYTREVFDRFQKLIAENTAFTLEQQQNDASLRFSLVASDRRDTRTYQVEADVANGLYDCNCNMFDMCGLICPHIIRVMVHLNIQVIPDRYLLERWSQAASKGAPVPDANTRPHMFGIPGTNTLRYNRLCRKMNRLASDACFSDETYELVSAAIDSVSVVVDAKRRGGDTQQEGEPDVVQVQAQQQTTEGELRNPPWQQPKGRPKESEKRKKPLLEQHEDAAKKKKKGKKDEETNTAEKTSTTAKRGTASKKKKMTGTKVTKCPFCLGDHHLVDCLVMKMKISAAQEAQGAATQHDENVPEVELCLKL